LGPKAFEQCAGFLRIRDGKNPLDASTVHPEAYPIVENILQSIHQKIDQVMGNSALLSQINAREFVTEQFGLSTINDILK
ncbi:RNA-binding transcriptional accessory protein, partial [Klebsiella aerogenes]|nr:RNA-binding transcriptional accessory protein [Klebsiella aerogenes]